MLEELPQDLSDLPQDDLTRATAERDDRVTMLFRRWPGLTEAERRELRKTYLERLRLARHIGWLRSRRRRAPRPTIDG